MKYSRANLNPNEKTLNFTEALIAMKTVHMAWVLHVNPLVLAHFTADELM